MPAFVCSQQQDRVATAYQTDFDGDGILLEVGQIQKDTAAVLICRPGKSFAQVPDIGADQVIPNV